MTDSEVGEANLPPFSFSKKPVSHIHTSAHSAISDIIPTSSVVRGPREGADGSLIPQSDTTSNTNLYNNIDYDEQIRAPRMNNVNYYSYNPTRQEPAQATNSGSGRGSGSVPSLRKDSSEEAKENFSTPSTTVNVSPSDGAKSLIKEDADEVYLPANFDLNQPIRRFSTASNNNLSESPKTTILNYTHNNYIYERNQGPRKTFGEGQDTLNGDLPPQHPPQESLFGDQPKLLVHDQQELQGQLHEIYQLLHQQYPLQRAPSSGDEEAINKDKLLKALENLKNNTTTRERQRSTASNSSAGSTGSQNSTRIRNRTANIPSNHLLNRNGTDLQQVYELKKPLCTPAVLRPIVTRSSSNNNVSGGTGSTSRPTTPGGMLNTLSAMDLMTPPPINSSLANGTSTGASAEQGESPTTPYVDIKGFPFAVPSGVNSVSPPGKLDPLRTDSVTQATKKVLFNSQSVEPTHEHWKPNNFTSHCMKCVGAFGNFFTPQRKRRHHCRFCGLIFCFECLWQLDSDLVSVGGGVGSNLGTNRLTRSISNSSLQPRTSRGDNGNANGSNGRYSQSSSQSNHSSVSSATESVGGVLMDAEARFVIPIFQELQKQDVNFQFEDHFKYSKVCKDCGVRYQNLIGELNSNEEAKVAPFVFIENPYLQQNKKNMSRNSYGNYESRQKSIERGRQMSGISKNDLPAGEFDGGVQQLQVNVPSDWSWSSF